MGAERNQASPVTSAERIQPPSQYLLVDGNQATGSLPALGDFGKRLEAGKLAVALCHGTAILRHWDVRGSEGDIDALQARAAA